ncbi:MAG: ATP-binding cassette domain-containing protein [Acidobacteria bacterium]|nr:ATP-binding cassette domain-containing protein [Acidobacteriota bacterium]
MPNGTGAPALVEIDRVAKFYGAPAPLRLRRLHVREGETLVLRGLDAAAAEIFVNLVTGASVPDEGHVRIAGRDTREIATDTEWLASLDRFGLVTLRAVLIGALPIAQNLALPMTLAIDPMADEVRAAVERLADEVELPRARLSAPAGTLSATELVRVHLARALAVQPALLLLEHPTVALDDPGERETFGAIVASAARARSIGWLALSDDEAFVLGTGAEAATVAPDSGELRRDGWWRRFLGKRRSS